MASGSNDAYTPASFSPSCHHADNHRPLYRCPACGTVHQPSLPSGSELDDLYREMRDDDYLLEEHGRRRTASRLLDLIAKQVPRGRLLEVGCSYGFLLDEARRLGYSVQGIELSAEAAQYARERLGLPVRELGIEDPALAEERYDVVVMVDVLEHLDYPRRALTRLRELLAPGGLLLIITPNPSSLTAKVTGRRWWGFLPAHVCLIPHRTLCDMLTAEGLVLTQSTFYVRSFTIGYWLLGLGEQAGRAGRLLGKIAGRLPRRPLLTASLGDERVLLIRNYEQGTSVSGVPIAS